MEYINDYNGHQGEIELNLKSIVNLNNLLINYLRKFNKFLGIFKRKRLFIINLNILSFKFNLFNSYFELIFN